MQSVTTADTSAQNQEKNIDMRKIIAIGECQLDIYFRNNTPWLSAPGAGILNAAASLGKQNRDISFVGEAAADHVGDMVVNFLADNNVGVNSVDRFTDGVTPATLIFTDDHGNETNRVRYERYSQQSFGVVWPRIDHDDVVMFGGSYVLDERVRGRLYDIVKYAHERKAIVVYVPGLELARNVNMTHVKPSILEYLEMSDIVLTSESDLKKIFGDGNGSKSYSRDISFYCFNHINIDFDEAAATFYNRKKTETAGIKCAPQMRRTWFAGAIAGVVDSLFTNEIMKETTEDLEPELMDKIVSEAARWGNDATESADRLVE